MARIKRPRSESALAASEPSTSSASTSTSLSALSSAPTLTPESSGRPKRRRPEEEIFTVGYIVARSLDKTRGPSGEKEYFYLVRWDGYGPDEDTWEPRSGLVQGARSLVTSFDAREQQVLILRSRGSKLNKTYLVRYGIENSFVPASPLYQEAWQTRDMMIEEGRLSEYTADMAIQNFFGRKFNPTVGYLSDGDDEEGPVLTELLSHARFKRKHTASSLLNSYKARWTEEGCICEAWFERSQLANKFGRETATSAVEKFRNALPSSPTSTQASSEYEEHRMKNIEDNLKLMQDLGLVV